jgi:hypothetical protein
MSPAAAPGSNAASLNELSHPLDKKAAYGLWEWGSVWRDCGLGGAAGSAASK